jgi:hypothetical protein
MRPILFSLFLWPISIVPSLQAAPDLPYLDIASQAANWILSREVDEKPKAAIGQAERVYLLKLYEQTGEKRLSGWRATG